MLNWALRYSPIVAFIKQKQPGSILEVGSGSQGLAHYLPSQFIIGTDVRFRKPLALNLLAISATALCLPFRSDSFDYVISSDMMEHLPEGSRLAAMNELIRVSKKHVVIGFPAGPAAEQVDRDIATALQRLGKEIPDWLSEYFEHRYPTCALLMEGLKNNPDIAVRLLHNSNISIHRFVIVGEMRRSLGKVLACLDSIAIVQLFSFLINVRPAYREIMFIEKTVTTRV